MIVLKDLNYFTQIIGVEIGGFNWNKVPTLSRLKATEAGQVVGDTLYKKPFWVDVSLNMEQLFLKVAATDKSQKFWFSSSSTQSIKT